MGKVRITIIIDIDIGILKKLDAMVDRKVFKNRSKAIQEAAEEKISRMHRNRLASECNKLDATFEQALADEWIYSELLEC